MTGTDKDLIDRLVRDLKPVPPHAVERRLLTGLGSGLIGAVAIMLLVLGPRQDWTAMIGSAAFQMKLAYACALGLAGLVALRQLARPLGRATSAVRAVPIIFGAVLLIAMVSLASTPPEARRALLLGSTALVCSFLITLISAPVLVVLLVVLRRLAPTRPAAAGAAAGLLAGAAGTFVYAFHCPENGLAFVALWYTAGIVLTTLIGSVIGRLALRWR